MADDFNPRRATRSFWQKLKQLKEIILANPGLINDRAAWHEYCRQHQVPPDLYRLVDFLPLLEVPLKEEVPPEEEQPEQPHRRTYWGPVKEELKSGMAGGTGAGTAATAKIKSLKATPPIKGQLTPEEQRAKFPPQEPKPISQPSSRPVYQPTSPVRPILQPTPQPSIPSPQRRYLPSFPSQRQGGPISRGLNLFRGRGGMGGMGGLGGRAGGGIGNVVNAARSAANMMMNLGRLAGMLGTPAGLPLMAILVVVGIFIVVFLIIMSQGGIGFGGVGNVGIAPPAGTIGVCPDQSAIETNRRQGSCRYLNPPINIFGDITDQQINTYVDKYWPESVNTWKRSYSRDQFATRVQTIVEKSRSVHLNPILFMGYWKSEGGFGEIFGCDPENPPWEFNIELDCALGKSPGGGSLASKCARSNSADSEGCKTLKDIRGKPDRNGKIYDQLHPINYPIKTMDDFAEAYGPYDHDSNNCLHAYNILLEVATSIGACTPGAYGLVSPGDYCGKSPQPLPPSSGGKTIVLNPGHAVNPVDPELNGAAGEAEKNVALAKKIKERLDNKGYQVFLTHDEKSTPDPTNRYNDYQQRIDFSNGKNADLFIEIHFNAGAGGPSTFYSDRRILSDDGANTRPNPNVVTQNVDQWISNSQKINQLIGTKIASKTSSSAENNIPDHRCMGRACGGHLFTIGPQGTLSDPSRPESIINRENKTVSGYVETLGINNPNANSLDLLADAYVEGVNEYFGLTSSSLAQNLPKTAGSIPSTNLAEAIQQQFGIKMVGFTDQELKWAWEKLGDISSSSFLRLTNSSPGDPITIDKTFNNCQQYHCKFIGFCQLGGETSFKIVLLHELGHIVHWCSGDRAKRTESYNFYATHAITAYGATDKTENYPEMLTYYLNPSVTEQTALGYARPIIPYSQPINNDYYQLSNKIMCNN